MALTTRVSVMWLVCLAWLPAPMLSWADAGTPCNESHAVTVSPEEYVGDTSLTELMSKLIAMGRKMAVGQVTTTRVLGQSRETIRNDDISFRSDTLQQFRGTVTAHEILSREAGRIGNRDTLRIVMRVNVCVTPADQVWYVRIADIKSETGGPFDWMKARFKSPTDRIQLVQFGEQRAANAAYEMRGLAFSENVSVRDYTNNEKIQAYNICVRKQKAQARTQRQVLGAFGLGSVGRIIEGVGSGPGSCGDPPKRARGRRLEAQAIFELKICDTHSGDCQSARQSHTYQRPVTTKGDTQAAVRDFYHEGFGLVGALALHNLQRTLGMLDK